MTSDYHFKDHLTNQNAGKLIVTWKYILMHHSYQMHYPPFKL